jgi:hypothetical protein
LRALCAHWPWLTNTLLQVALILPRLACRHASTRIVSSLADLQYLRTSGAHAARSCGVPCCDCGRAGKIANARKTVLTTAALQIICTRTPHICTLAARVGPLRASVRKVSVILTRRHKDVCALVSTCSSLRKKLPRAGMRNGVGTPLLGCGVSKQVSRIGFSLMRRRVYMSRKRRLESAQAEIS